MDNPAAAGARAIGLAAAASLVGAFTLAAHARETCAPATVWTAPGSGPVDTTQILTRAAGAQVTLLGENHDDPDHHRWELQTVAALAALHPKLVLGFEMFPRRVQTVLDRWVAGDLNESAFLKLSDWSQVWGTDATFYLPLFQFARINRIPIVALNVERSFTRTVNKKGLAAVPKDKREGVSEPAAASEAYLARLFEVYSRHPFEKNSTPARSDPAFHHFVEAQLVWDRAMAQALAGAAARHPDALVVGVMGSRHIAHGDGVPHQLDNLGIKRIVSLLPWDADADCSDLSPDLATAVFGLPARPPQPATPPQPLLGIQIEAVANGVRVVAVKPGSVASASGLQTDDVLTEAAGTAVKTTGELKAIVVRMAPGTWLPLKATRNGKSIELTARFPPAEK